MMNGNQVLKCDLLEIFFPMILWCAHWYISLRWCHARIICDWGFQSHLVVIIEAKSHITLNAARWIFSLKTIRFSLGFPFVASLRQESQVSDPDYPNSSTLSPLLATIRVNICFSVNVSRNSDVTAGLWSFYNNVHLSTNHLSNFVLEISHYDMTKQNSQDFQKWNTESLFTEFVPDLLLTDLRFWEGIW